MADCAAEGKHSKSMDEFKNKRVGTCKGRMGDIGKVKGMHSGSGTLT